MYDFGVADGHANQIHWGDLAAFDGLTSYSFAMQIYVHANPGGARVLFGKWGGGVGWMIRMKAGRILESVHDGNVSNTTAATVGLTTQETLVVRWDGANSHFLFNGAVHEAEAQAQAITANAINFGIGGDAASGVGCRLGHFMGWPNTFLTDEEAESYHAGIIPRPAALGHWAPGWTDPGIELSHQTVSTKVAVVTIVEDAFEQWPTLPKPHSQLGLYSAPPTPRFVLIN